MIQWHRVRRSILSIITTRMFIRWTWPYSISSRGSRNIVVVVGDNNNNNNLLSITLWRMDSTISSTTTTTTTNIAVVVATLPTIIILRGWEELERVTPLEEATIAILRFLPIPMPALPSIPRMKGASSSSAGGVWTPNDVPWRQRSVNVLRRRKRKLVDAAVRCSSNDNISNINSNINISNSVNISSNNISNSNNNISRGISCLGSNE